MLRPTCALVVTLCLLVSPALAERKWFVRPSRAEQIREMHGPYNSAEALRPSVSHADRTYLLNDLQKPTRPLPQPSAKAASKAPPTGVTADILQIRRALHESDPAEEAEFAEALRDVVGAPKTPATSPLQGDGDPEPIQLKKRSGPVSNELIANLHQSARQFDMVAATYEERGEFELADKSRQVAHSLRLEARKLIAGDVRPLALDADRN